MHEDVHDFSALVIAMEFRPMLEKKLKLKKNLVCVPLKTTTCLDFSVQPQWFKSDMVLFKG
jgi:hypothetical protein